MSETNNVGSPLLRSTAEPHNIPSPPLHLTADPDIPTAPIPVSTVGPDTPAGPLLVLTVEPNTPAGPLPVLAAKLVIIASPPQRLIADPENSISISLCSTAEHSPFPHQHEELGSPVNVSPAERPQ